MRLAGKNKFKNWLTLEGLILIRGWAYEGKTDEEIAGKIGVHPSTFYAWKKKYAQIDEALKKGKEVVDFMVENALLKNALNGDTTAQIFWLKNRRPDKWRNNGDDVKMTETKIHDYFVKLTEVVNGA